ncbi:hypothetical protein HHI36_002597, partial [Cryptolaemus montrouzieri]
AGNAEDLAARIRANQAACLKDNNVDSNLLAKAKKGTIDESNPVLLSYLLCFIKKSGYINDAVELQEDEITDKLLLQKPDKAEVDRVVKLCDATANPGDNGLFIARVLTCYYKNVPGVIIL